MIIAKEQEERLEKEEDEGIGEEDEEFQEEMERIEARTRQIYDPRQEPTMTRIEE
jgi:hypothetical protein